ncbi:unnamed protein product [Penicillium manginii]
MTLDEVNSQFGRNSNTCSVASVAENNILINKALTHAVYAFSVRWVITRLPNNGSEICTDVTQEAHDRLSEDLWHRARENMYPLLGRPSYRSSLALYLFGITPVTPQNPEFRFSDVCLENSLKQLKELRLGDSNKPSYDWPCRGSIQANLDARSADSVSQYHHMENTAFWFGIVCDISRCLLSGTTSVILLGKAITLRIRQLVRQQLDEFRANYGNLHRSQLPLPDDIVLKILCHGSASKTLCWWRIVEVRDAVSRGETHVSIKEVIGCCLEEIAGFENTFQPFLNLFTRDYVFLKREFQVGVFLLTLHFHLGVLAFLDIIHQMPNLRGILVNYSVLLLDSTRGLINLTRLVLSLTEDQEKGMILLVDPYPEHISKCLWYAGRAILDLRQECVLSSLAAESMFKVSVSGLSVLQKVSFSARERLEALRQLYPSQEVAKSVDNSTSPNAIPFTVAINSQMIRPDSVEGLADEITIYPNLINDTVTRHEAALGIERALGIDSLSSILALEELDWNQVDTFIEHWDFMDCFVQV